MCIRDSNHLAFDNSRRIRTLVVQGVPEETEPGEMAREFADFVQHAAYAVDEEGNRVCLYERRPDSYTKTSRYCSEDSEDFQIEFPQESQLLTDCLLYTSPLRCRMIWLCSIKMPTQRPGNMIWGKCAPLCVCR